MRREKKNMKTEKHFILKDFFVQNCTEEVGREREKKEII